MVEDESVLRKMRVLGVRSGVPPRGSGSVAGEASAEGSGSGEGVGGGLPTDWLDPPNMSSAPPNTSTPMATAARTTAHKPLPAAVDGAQIGTRVRALRESMGLSLRDRQECRMAIRAARFETIKARFCPAWGSKK